MVRRKKLDSTNSNSSPRSSPRPVRKMSAGSAKLLAMKNVAAAAAENGNGEAHPSAAAAVAAAAANEGLGLLDKYDIGKTIGDGNFAVRRLGR